jgi:hypothetical protein
MKSRQFSWRHLITTHKRTKEAHLCPDQVRTSHMIRGHMIPWENKNARWIGKTWVRFGRSWRQVTNQGDDGGRVLRMVLGCVALQLAGLCDLLSATSIEHGSGGGAARRTRNTEQTAAAFYNGDGPATVAGRCRVHAGHDHASWAGGRDDGSDSIAHGERGDSLFGSADRPFSGG